jgi:hypothetical protein
VIFYLLMAAVVAALDPGSDTGGAIASGLLWPLAALELAWKSMVRFFGPVTLTMATAAIVKRGRWTGVEIAFFDAIGH